MSAGCGSGGGSSPQPILVSLRLTPLNPTFVAGTSFHFAVIGTYSNGTTIDVSQTANWTSSDTTVATIGNTSGSKGVATTVAAGSTTITATVNGISASTTLTVTGNTSTGANVMRITVNGDLCSAATSAGYVNKPCVSVTVCNPNSSTCQTITDLLLDTGSTGLRVFSSAIPNLTLPQVTTSGGGSLAGCVGFADGSSLWGPIKMASVQLGNEPAVLVPIQVIDSTFGIRPSGCSNADPTPVSAGFNGILGVDVFAQDCGPACVSSALNGMYYSCNGSGCSGTTVPTANQVANPVVSLPVDNNGVQVQLPPVPLGGVASLSGSLILGINTQSNNTPGAVTVLPEDTSGDFRTLYPTSSTSNDSFVDTGSNALFIPNLNPSVLPTCASPNQAWYCPPVTRSLFATATGFSGLPAVNVPFNVGNFITVASDGNSVFSEIAGTSTFGFDWGLPFFMGRNVFLGYEQKIVPSLGTGPFVAF